jgi:acyl-CoA dehydrogenase
VAWDFSTDPEFEEKLEWMRTFVRDEVWPIEAIQHDIGQAELDLIYEPLHQLVKEHGLWAAHLPPELGGQGFGQVKLGLMNEILGTSIFAPNAFGCQAPDSGNSEIIALAGTAEQKERWLYPLLNGELKSAFSMTEPDTAGSDPTQLRTRAVRCTPCRTCSSRPGRRRPGPGRCCRSRPSSCRCSTRRCRRSRRR